MLAITHDGMDCCVPMCNNTQCHIAPHNNTQVLPVSLKTSQLQKQNLFNLISRSESQFLQRRNLHYVPPPLFHTNLHSSKPWYGYQEQPRGTATATTPPTSPCLKSTALAAQQTCPSWHAHCPWCELSAASTPLPPTSKTALPATRRTVHSGVSTATWPCSSSSRASVARHYTPGTSTSGFLLGRRSPSDRGTYARVGAREFLWLWVRGYCLGSALGCWICVWGLGWR